MGGGGQTTISGGFIAAVIILTAWPLVWPANYAALAEQPAVTPLAQSAPAPFVPSIYYPNMLALAFAAPAYDFGKADPGKFRKDTPEFTLPDRVDLGNYMLRLDTSRTPTEFVPRASTDAPDLSDVIAPARFGKKHGRGLRNYFGLTLTTATQ
jgi:hypothetical protein